MCTSCWRICWRISHPHSHSLPQMAQAPLSWLHFEQLRAFTGGLPHFIQMRGILSALWHIPRNYIEALRLQGAFRSCQCSGCYLGTRVYKQWLCIVSYVHVRNHRGRKSVQVRYMRRTLQFGRRCSESQSGYPCQIGIKWRIRTLDHGNKYSCRR